MVRSLFCGLPRQDKRMAVFVLGLDETTGKTDRDIFLLAGFVAPEQDWSRFFAPAWQERVLDGPPAIPYLHMTEIRSRSWRDRHGLSRLEADDRIDEALRLVDTMQSLYPIGVRADAAFVRDRFSEVKVMRSSLGKPSRFEPDYICFLSYVWIVMNYIEQHQPNAEKVDFIVERNGNVTKHIQDFHSTLAQQFTEFGKPSLAQLVGDLIPAGKERVPLQAADLLCWHTARAESPETMDDADIRRYRLLASRNGTRETFSNEQIAQMAVALGV
jgi:hypothetical protein